MNKYTNKIERKKEIKDGSKEEIYNSVKLKYFVIVFLCG